MDSSQTYYTKPLPLREAPEAPNVTNPNPAITVVAPARTTRGVPFAPATPDAVAGTPAPRRRANRRTRRINAGQLELRLFDQQDVATLDFGTASDNPGLADGDDSPATGPSPAPAPVKPRPVGGPRSDQTGDVIPEDSEMNQGSNNSFPRSMFDLPGFASRQAGVSTSEQENDKYWIPTGWMQKQFGKPKYGRNSTAYDRAQTTEKPAFLKLLSELCDGIQDEPQSMGRPRMAMRDMVYSIVHKVYSLYSLRRHNRELREAKALGYINRVPQYSTVCRYMQDPELVHILMDMVTASAIPLKGMDRMTLMDSTGFSTSRFVRWFNKRWGKETDTREWVKAHIACGETTKIVTAVQITGWDAHDSTFFKPLLERTTEYFDVESVAADKAYLSEKNLGLAMLSGQVPYIPFKSNTVIPTDRHGTAWSAMYHYFRFNQDEFYSHYHQRSKVESVMNMIKSKFGDAVRSKNYIAQVNETLAKVLCHNIVENHKASVALGCDINFQFDGPVQREIAW